MSRTILRNQAPLVVGGFALGLYLFVAWLMPLSTREALRENDFDFLLSADRLLRPDAPDQRHLPVVVVDIDRHSLETYGPWPWPRTIIARLVASLAAQKPRVITIDILFADPDTRSPAAVARRLSELVQRADIAALADTLPDGDKLLADAIAGSSVALGFVLDPAQRQSIAGVPILLRGRAEGARFWSSPGAVGPIPPLVDVAHGLGALSLSADADGVVRRVPLLVTVAGQLRPGLALEAARLAHRGSAYLVETNPSRLVTQDLRLRLPRDALLRLLPVSPEVHRARTISAADVIESKGDLPSLSGAVVLLGGSAPELGGLRPTATEPLVSSAQIQADALTQIERGRAPEAFSESVEYGAAFAAGVIALAGSVLLAPWFSLAVVGLIGLLVLATSLTLSVYFDRLLDPALPFGAAIVVFIVASVVSYAAARRREARVRRRFEQHLAPAVVSRIVEDPNLVKLSGERREITALFTDIQNFTSMTHRATPVELVKLLDGYIEGVADIVIRHGGMIDKIVGDAVHAIFNSPIDLEHHPVRAVECAIAISDWTHQYRSTPVSVALGLERTRIGLETGEAIVGDVGIRTKLDYTAHGDVMITAARLEAANKALGSAICIGPVAASHLDPATIRPLGKFTLRGYGEPLPVFEPWPPQLLPAARERYLAAFGMIDGNWHRAVELFEALAKESANDPVPALMAERLRHAEGG